MLGGGSRFAGRGFEFKAKPMKAGPLQCCYSGQVEDESCQLSIVFIKGCEGGSVCVFYSPSLGFGKACPSLKEARLFFCKWCL